nr:MAG TPA: hypothetical protein [Caudoviricetes sp.]
MKWAHREASAVARIAISISLSAGVFAQIN